MSLKGFILKSELTEETSQEDEDTKCKEKMLMISYRDNSEPESVGPFLRTTNFQAIETFQYQWGQNEKTIFKELIKTINLDNLLTLN